jgi:hypothetical protein
MNESAGQVFIGYERFTEESHLTAPKLVNSDLQKLAGTIKVRIWSPLTECGLDVFEGWQR